MQFIRKDTSARHDSTHLKSQHLGGRNKIWSSKPSRFYTQAYTTLDHDSKEKREREKQKEKVTTNKYLKLSEQREGDKIIYFIVIDRLFYVF